MVKSRLLFLLVGLSCPAYAYQTIFNPWTGKLDWVGVSTTSLSGNFIQNTNTLQSGATFYTSSGTANNFNAVTVNISSPIEITQPGVTTPILFQTPDGQTLYVGQNQNLLGLGTFNTGVGAFSLEAGGVGSFNTGIGNSSLAGCTSGTENSAFGYASCPLIVDGSYNICNGANSLALNIHGNYNTAVGAINTLYAVTGSSNTGIGAQAGYGENGVGDCTTGEGNIFIGRFTGFGSSGQHTRAMAFGNDTQVTCSSCAQFGGPVGSGLEVTLIVATETINTNLLVGSITVTGLVQASSNVYLSTGGVVGFDEYVNGSYAVTSTITWSNGNDQVVTLTANTTFNFSAPPYTSHLNLLIKTGAGSFTASWPGAVKWPSATAPTITTAASQADLCTFYYEKQTGDYFGQCAQAYTP